MPFKKLVLSLDPLPQPTSRATPRTAGTINSGGKRKRAVQEAEAEPNADAQEDEIEPQDPSTPIRIKREGVSRAKSKDQGPSITQVVGIDNDMSGSGMSYAPIYSDPSRVMAETEWPMGEGMMQKVPSKVALYEDNVEHKEFRNESDNFFGFETPEDAETVSYYKISMDADAMGKQLFSGQDTVKNKAALAVAMRSLRKIHWNKVKDALGEDALSDIKFVHVTTYPAACSLRGTQAQRDAIEQAGYLDRPCDRTEFISEAHAAVMATFVTCKAQHGVQTWNTIFKVGNLVTILDLGALTNDLATVEITKNDPLLALEEVTVPTGGKCGTAAIHCRILNVLEKKFGDAFRELPDAHVKRGSRFFQSCETILRRFDGMRLDRIHRLPLKLRLPEEHDDYDEEDEDVILTAQDIKDAIDGSLKYTKDLLKDQWSQQKVTRGGRDAGKTPQTTVLCGGGSLIPYVFEELKKYCDENKSRPIRAKDPESTVCRGAVISQLNQKLFGQRLSSASFGILVEKDGNKFINWFISQVSILSRVQPHANILRGDVMDASKETVLKAVGGHVTLSVAEVINSAQKFELDIFTYNRGGRNPEKPNAAGVEKASSIKIDSEGMSTDLRNKLMRQLTEANPNIKYLTMTVSVAIDRSARLTFEAKHERALIGKG